MQDQLFVAAQYLDDMINDKGLRVFVHCATGITRAPTLAIIYLALTKRHKDWKDPKKLESAIRKSHIDSFPNFAVAERVVKDNKDFQDD